MGWTGGRDPLPQLELTFPTLEAAIAYARRQGLSYVVRHDARSRKANALRARQRRAFSDTTLRRLGLRRLQHPYGEAMARADAVEDKRSMLMNRAYDEYLAGEWGRLQEIERALQLLEADRSEGAVAA